MSIRRIRDRRNYTVPKGFRLRSADLTAQETTWIRPGAWLTLPSVDGLQKMVILQAIDPCSGNFASLKCTTSSGNYLVDWGDSSSNSIASGTQADHLYDYTTYDSSSTTRGPVTFAGATDLVNRTSHGYQNGDLVQFYAIVTTTGLTEDYDYYVINATTDSFQVSLTPNGSAIDLVNDGSAYLLPYKQAIIVVTPVSGNLTGIDLSVKNAVMGLASTCCASQFLDLSIEGQYISSLSITSGYQIHRRLKCISLTGANAISTLASCFTNIYSLEKVAALSAPNCSNFNSCFYACRNLFDVSALTLSYSGGNVTADSMFSGCTRLQHFRGISGPKITSAASMLYSCANLVTCADLTDLPELTAANSMFDSCLSLQNVPYFNFPKVTTVSGMFSGCKSLVRSPNITLPATCTSVNNMYNSCSALLDAGGIIAPGAQTAQTIYASCFGLQVVARHDFPAATSIQGMFQSCAQLTEQPKINAPNATNISYLFNLCTALKSLALNFPSAQNASYVADGCSCLQAVTELSLPAVTDISYGFRNCYAMTSVCDISLPNALNCNYMFNGNSILGYVPSLSLPKATSTSYMFASTGLYQIPNVNLPEVLDASAMFNTCKRVTKLTGTFSMPKATTISNLFSYSNFVTVRDLSFPAAQNASYLFQYCYMLKKVASLYLPACTNVSNMFAYCYSLERSPGLSLPAGATLGSVFNNCEALSYMGAINSTAKNPSTLFGANLSLPYGNFTNVAFSVSTGISVVNPRWGAAEIMDFVSKVAKSNTTSAYVQLTFNTYATYGTYAKLTKTCSITKGNTTATCANTSGISVGMECKTICDYGLSVTFTDTGDLVTYAGHGFQAGDEITFSTISSTSGPTAWTKYFVINPTTDTFQISTTAGGSSVAISGNGTGTMFYTLTVASFVANTSITFNRKWFGNTLTNGSIVFYPSGIRYWTGLQRGIQIILP